MELKEYLDELNKLNEAKDDYEYDKKNISFTKYDDDLEYAYSEWAVVKSKTVRDEDGEKTKLVWYYRTGDPLHLFMLGNPETTEPNEDEAEFTTKSVVKAREYFDNYSDNRSIPTLKESIHKDVYDYMVEVYIEFKAKKFEYYMGAGNKKVKNIEDIDIINDGSDDEELLPLIELLYDHISNIQSSIIEDKEYISKKLNSELLNIDYDSEDPSSVEFYLTFTNKLTDKALEVLKPYFENTYEGTYKPQRDCEFKYEIKTRFDISLIET